MFKERLAKLVVRRPRKTPKIGQSDSHNLQTVASLIGNHFLCL